MEGRAIFDEITFNLRHREKQMLQAMIAEQERLWELVIGGMLFLSFAV